MEDDFENDNYTRSPFGRFIQKNDKKELNSLGSLTDFIKAHAPKSALSNNRATADDNKPASLLSTLSSQHTNNDNLSLNLFNNDSETCHNLNSCINKSIEFDNFSCEKIKLTNVTDVEKEDFSTLEQYTKSFLHSKGTQPIPSGRFQILCPQSSVSSRPKFPHVPHVNSNLVTVNEKLSQIRISCSDDESNANLSDLNDPSSDNTNNFNNWNIDLSVALQDVKLKKVETATSLKLNELRYEPSVYSAHVKECYLDISSLANEKILYSDAVLSSFGYVLNRKWKKLPLSKKFKKIGVNWPYNKSKSFKFDSPSPDDIILKNKAKIRTTSLNEA